MGIQDRIAPPPPPPPPPAPASHQLSVEDEPSKEEKSSDGGASVVERSVFSDAGENESPGVFGSTYTFEESVNFDSTIKQVETPPDVRVELPHSAKSKFAGLKLSRDFLRDPEEGAGAAGGGGGGGGGGGRPVAKTPCYSPKLKKDMTDFRQSFRFGSIGSSSGTGSPNSSGYDLMSPPYATGHSTETGSTGLRKWRRCSAAAIKAHSEGAEYFREGQTLYDLGFYSRANVFFTKAVEYQQLPSYLSWRAKCWAALGENRLALQDAMQAIERSKRPIEKYLLNIKKKESSHFLEHYLVRGMCFAKQGGLMGSQLALHDFKVVTTQSNKLGCWPGAADPKGWEERKLSAEEEYEDESQQIAELDDDEREEYERDREPLAKLLARARLGIVLDEVTELKTAVSGEMALSDEYDFEHDWRSHAMSNRTDDLLLPSALDAETVSKLLGGMLEGRLMHHADFLGLLTRVREVLLGVENVVHVDMEEDTEVHVVGDIHGQFHDLLNILHLTGVPTEDNVVIFNGDFVDRGAYGVECVTALLLMKLTYPQWFHIVRGNHEDHAVNEQYHFLAEVLLKYGSCDLYHAIQAVFKLLPLAHVVGGKVFVTHGGVPGPDVTVADLQAFDRNCDVPETGLMTNLLWSDPHPEDGLHPSGRGRGQLYGPDITRRFLEANGFERVVRSHDVTACMETGYAEEQDGLCITVFSAPNYCNSYGNKAAIVRLSVNRAKEAVEYDFVTFEATPIPKQCLEKVWFYMPPPPHTHTPFLQHAPHPYHFNFTKG